MTEIISKEDHIKLISQGAYGCVFKNENKKQKKEEFIIKIQKKEETSDNEKIIGKKIVSIVNYKNYFAPILQTEDINISKLDNEDIEECEVIRDNEDPKAKYESEKIRYIGKDTLLNYYVKIISDKKFIHIFVENHIILLEALEKLESAGIIHYDLKENNIMIQDDNKRPIIIDFGLSIDSTQPMEKSFYSYYTKYVPWCIDIVFLSYIVNEVEDSNNNISTKDIKYILDDFFENNPINQKLLIQEERNIWKTKLENYFNKFINKPWKTLYDELIKYKFTWDNYSITAMYLFLFYDLNLEKYSHSTFLNNYVDLLKTNITTTPDERTNANNIKKKILKIFKSIQRIKIQNLKKILIEKYTIKDEIKDIEKNMGLSMADDKKNEKIVYKSQ